MKDDKCIKNDCCGFVWPFFLISAGIILVLNNFNIIPWEFWNEAFRFWPTIFIIIGITNMLNCCKLGRVISFFLSLAIILFVSIHSLSVVNRNFDRWIRSVYPFWESIERIIPDSQGNRYYPQFRGRGRVFDCSPLDENCYRFFED